MIRFVVNRPVAVSMSLVVLFILGGVAWHYIPVSLVPDADIPEIVVKVEQANTSARTLENTIVAPLRRQFLQLSHLKDITTHSTNETAYLRLLFDYKTNTDLAFIEVNEHIDLVMNQLPPQTQRPVALKMSATDLPVFYLSFLPADSTASRTALLEFSEFVNAVLKRRLEQLPEVALADVSGLVFPEIIITPDKQKMASYNINYQDIVDAFQKNNISYGSFLLQENNYVYSVQLSNELTTIEDIKMLFLKKGTQYIQLQQVATVKEEVQPQRGMYLYNGQPAVVSAIIKQANARMDNLQQAIYQFKHDIERTYPGVKVKIDNDQTALLDVSLKNLTQSLVLGGILAFSLMFLFFRNRRLPWLIGLSIPVSLTFSILCMYLLNISINIISLTGLLLGVGMIVDNSIIVIDNIIQQRQQQKELTEACFIGAYEVSRPMLSSILTTSAVFVPLVFLEGIASVLFFDLAVAVSIGLLASFLVSVLVIPVYFRLFFLNNSGHRAIHWQNRWLTKFYHAGHSGIWKHKRFALLIIALAIALVPVLFSQFPKQKIPDFEQTDQVVHVQWNTSIPLEANRQRLEELRLKIADDVAVFACFVGEQQFMLNQQNASDVAGASIYIKLHEATDLSELLAQIEQHLTQYPKATVSFSATANLFEKLITAENNTFVAKIYNQANEITTNHLAEIAHDSFLHHHLRQVETEEFIELNFNPAEITQYHLTAPQIYETLQIAFNWFSIGQLNNTQRSIPVRLGVEHQNLDQIIQTTSVENLHGTKIPLRHLITTRRHAELKTITAGKDGEYLPLIHYVEKRFCRVRVGFESGSSRV